MSAIVDFFGIAVIIAVVKVVITFAALLGTTIVVVWFERKVIADMQARIDRAAGVPSGFSKPLPTASSSSSRRTSARRPRTNGLMPLHPLLRWCLRSLVLP